jgi:hypothetical protein
MISVEEERNTEPCSLVGEHAGLPPNSSQKNEELGEVSKPTTLLKSQLKGAPMLTTFLKLVRRSPLQKLGSYEYTQFL